MKKILAIIMSCVLFLVGCNKNNEYIETVMNIRFEDGKTVEKIVNEKVIAGEFYLDNTTKLKFNRAAYGLSVVAMKISEEKQLKKYYDLGVVMPLLKELDWKIEGNTENGKVVVAKTDRVLVRIPTVKNGDYVQVNKDDIAVYELKTNTRITDEEIVVAKDYYDLLNEYKYNKESE